MTLPPSLRNYGRVLFAGGLAAVYFTTYAAHHLENLRIIQSPLLDGLLLLGWTAFMSWLADRRKSELFSLFAIGLAYYAAIITRVGLFTLYSNLVLAGAAIWFLLRNRWTTLSYASLVATHAGYAFWRFSGAGEGADLSPAELLWTGAAFLMCYWTAFTAAGFLSRHEKLTGVQRATFLTLNNSLFFVLFVATLLHAQHEGFWVFALAYGATLLALCALAFWQLADEPLIRAVYLIQGLLLVTVGWVAKFSGLELGLLLAAQSVAALLLGQRLGLKLLEGSAYPVAVLATLACLDGLLESEATVTMLGAVVGGMLLFNGAWLARGDSADASIFRLRSGSFAIMGLLVWWVDLVQQAPREPMALLLAAGGLLLCLVGPHLKFREVVLLAQGYLVSAHLVWLYDVAAQDLERPWWVAAGLIVLTLVMAHWWQRQRDVPPVEGIPALAQAIYAVAVVCVLHFWLQPLLAGPKWLAAAGLLTVGLTLYGRCSGFAWLMVAGQFFVLVMVWEFVTQLRAGHPHWVPALVAVAVPGLLSALAPPTSRAGVPFDPAPDRTPSGLGALGVGRLAYRWLSLALGIGWVLEYAPANEYGWIFALLGTATFLVAGGIVSREALWMSAVVTALGVWFFWLPEAERLGGYLPDLCLVACLAAQQRLARRWPERFPVEEVWHSVMILLASASLWRFLSLSVETGAGGFYLTGSWAALALVLFSVGLLLRERMYRWAALALLALALGRVALVDVWRLETIYRTLSFFALGVVLLVLGFLYNRYQEAIRRWL